MEIFKYSKYDSLSFLFTFFQILFIFYFAYKWDESGYFSMLFFIITLFLMTYNIIVISHFFSHTKWFNLELLNNISSIINSFNIGQSVERYKLTHVKNHHRYNNDRLIGSKEIIFDKTSTFSIDKKNTYISPYRYIFVDAFHTLISSYQELILFKKNKFIVSLFSRTEKVRKKESLNLFIDNAFRLILTISLILISWKYYVFCYVPCLYLAFAFVNMHNYYEHYGCIPEDKYANSVSYYGNIYNKLSFNDGYHQEHHFSPTTHWSKLPTIRYIIENGAKERVVSKYPAILGYFDKSRVLLNKKYIGEDND